MSESQGNADRETTRRVEVWILVLILAAVLVVGLLAVLGPDDLWPSPTFWGYTLSILALGAFALTAWRGFRQGAVDALAVRLAGPGEHEAGGAPSEVRKAWIEQQSRRAWLLIHCSIWGIVLGLLLYSLNHLTWVQKPGELKLTWQTHAERLEYSGTYQTVPGDTWAKLAEAKGWYQELAELNPHAAFIVDESTGTKVGTDDKVRIRSAHSEKAELALRRHTVSGAADALGVTPTEIVSGFRDAKLVPGQRLVLPRQKPVDPREWIDWVLWGLIGVSAYLVMISARYYLKINEGEGNFFRFTPWYLSQAVTGPLIAFVILFLLTQLDVRVGGGGTGDDALALSLRSFPPDLLVVPAFLLGFYSRVGRKVLDQIMRGMFAAAWLEAEGGFEIRIKGEKRSVDTVESGKSVMLETAPSTTVNWHCTEGKIDPSGAFTAPVVDGPKDVVVMATAIGGAKQPEARILHIVPVKATVEIAVSIKDDEAATVAPGESRVLIVTGLPDSAEASEVEWSCGSGAELDPAIGWETTATISDDAKAGDEIEVTATWKDAAGSLSLTVGEAEE